MTVSNFNLTNKGAAITSGTDAENGTSSFTYLMADAENMNFHMFIGESEAWINHRDDGQAKNVDPRMVERLVSGISSKKMSE